MNKNNTIFIGEGKSFRERNRRSNGYLLKHTVSQITISVVRALLMFGLCFMIIQPLITRFSVSLMAAEDIYDSTIRLLDIACDVSVPDCFHNACGLWICQV